MAHHSVGVLRKGNEESIGKVAISSLLESPPHTSPSDRTLAGPKEKW